MTLTILLTIVSAVLLSGAARAQTRPAQEYWLPMKLYDEHVIVVQGAIGDLRNRKLLIDTGAYPSVIDEGIAKHLGLAGAREELRVLDHTLPSKGIVLPSLRVGPIAAGDLPVMVQDLSRLGDKLGTRIDGVIGLDVLARSSFRINYEAEEIAFGPVDPLPWSLPLQLLDSMVCVETHIDGQRLRLLVDTGASGTVLFRQKVAGLAPRHGNLVGVSNLGGSVTMHQIRLSEFLLGGANFGPRDILISESENMTSFAFDGLLATADLPFRQIAFDFEHDRFAWQMWDPVAQTAHLARASARPARAATRATSFINSGSLDTCGSVPGDPAVNCTRGIRVPPR